MKQRILFLVQLYILFLLLFMAQKVLFMLVNLAYAPPMGFGDWCAVLWHGLRLDSVTACALMVMPTLTVAVSLAVPRIKVRTTLCGYYLLIALLATLAFMADTVLYFFWGAKIDANDFVYAKNPKDLFASVTLWATLCGSIALLLATAGTFLLLRRATPQRFTQRVRWYAPLLLVLVMGFEFLGFRGSVKESTANPSFAYFSPQPFLNHAALNPLFNITRSMMKSEDLAHDFDFYSPQTVATLTATAYPKDNAIGDTLLAMQRPNILLIVWEGAGSQMVLNDSVAPNLMQMKAEGVFFAHCYANNFRTDRGTVSLLNGWPGLPTTSLMKMSDKCRKLPALAKTLRRCGYSTTFCYGGDIDFTNMRCYLLETGFEQVWGDEHYAHATTHCKWGVADEELLRLPLPNAAQPFFTTLLTLSSHEPWDVPTHRLGDSRCNAFAYTDSCLGAYITQLKASPLWDSLLVIIVPDHGVPTTLYNSTSHPKVAEIPMLWLGGAVKEAKQIEVMMNQSDMVATLLAQMGIDADDFVFSRNVLSPAYQQPFVLHAFKNGMNYIDIAHQRTYDCTKLVGTQPDSVEFPLALLQQIYTTTAQLK